MKAILEFELPQDAVDYRIANNSGAYYSILWELQEYLIKKYKYAEPSTDYAREECQEIKDYFFELLKEKGIVLDD